MELAFGTEVTLTGTLEQIKTFGDGKAVSPSFLTTEGNIIVKAARDFAPNNADEEVEDMEPS